MPKQITTEIFISKANNKHNYKYSYKNTIYIKATNKVKILCNDHGEFEQTPHDHLKGRGCPQCGKLIVANKTRYSEKEYIDKANKIHNNSYTYYLSNYKNNRSKIKIFCKEHGEFEQKASSHLEGYGCKQCSLQKMKKTTNQFIKQANIKHNSLYIYTKTVYTGCKNAITVTCKQHDDFITTPNNHLNGQGCPKCANNKRIENLKNCENNFSLSGYKAIIKKRECTFYILECFNNTEKFYKIGITVNLKNRYNSKKHMPYSYKILKEIKGEAEDIWTLENNLKQKLKSKYKPEIKFAGSTRECYSDIDEILKALP